MMDHQRLTTNKQFTANCSWFTAKLLTCQLPTASPQTCRNLEKKNISQDNSTRVPPPPSERGITYSEGAVIAPRLSEEVTLQCNVHPLVKEGRDAVA